MEHRMDCNVFWFTDYLKKTCIVNFLTKTESLFGLRYSHSCIVIIHVCDRRYLCSYSIKCSLCQCRHRSIQCFRGSYSEIVRDISPTGWCVIGRGRVATPAGKWKANEGVLAQRGRAIGKHRFRRASDEKNFQLADAPAASRNVACARRQHDDAPPLFAKKRPKLITFGVNNRFAVDGTIDRPLDTIKSRPFRVVPLPSRRYNSFLFAYALRL